MADIDDSKSGEEAEIREHDDDMNEPSANDELITSSEANTIDVVLIDEQHADIVSSGRGEVVEQIKDTLDTGQCTSSDDRQQAEGRTNGKAETSQSECDIVICDESDMANVKHCVTNNNDHSDNESEIIVDDSPMPEETLVEQVGSSGNIETAIEQIEEPNEGNKGVESGSRFFDRLSSPSPSYIRLATPSTPGTPRLRSGSVSGTAFAPLSPKPSPSARATPGERQRAGSMGEIELRDKLIGHEFRHGVRIIDNLDILQLPRPRNPGGILPESEQSLINSSNEALNLTLDERQHPKQHTGNNSIVSSSFSSILPSDMISVSSSVASAKPGNTCYLISNIMRSTPNRLGNLSNVNLSTFASRTRGCAINESVERPLPSSVVDSEGVAKKIARLDSGGFLSSTGDSMWNTPASACHDDHLARVRVLSDKTPPERPKPPRRTTLSPAENGSLDMSHHRSFVASNARRQVSPGQPLSLHRGTPSTNGHSNGNTYRPSNDEICMLPHHYKCRLCSYSSSSYNMLQVHSTKHGGSSKTFRCSLCDYTTHEKSCFRRHRRLHHKSSPVSFHKCMKCTFMTSVSRKLREHYQQSHPEVPDQAQSSQVAEVTSEVMSGPRYSGPNGALPAEPTSLYPGPYYDNSLMLNRTDRVGYSYSIPGRQPPVNFPLDQYGLQYGSNYRDRGSESLASSYLRSIVSSIMNSETSRQAATSTVTSSNYYVPPGADNSHPIQDIHTCNSHGPCPHEPCSGIKIKVETEVDNVSDVSSTAHSGSAATPDTSRMGSHTCRITETSDSNQTGAANVGLHLSPISHQRHEDNVLHVNGSADLPTDLSRRRKNGNSHADAVMERLLQVSSEVDIGNDMVANHGHSLSSPCPSNTIIKTDNATRAVQCILPIVKSDVDFDRVCMRFNGRPCIQGVDRAVQCNMNSSSTAASSNSRSQCHAARLTFRSQSVSESDVSEHPSSVCGESRCEFCGINFEDEVLFSIHIGCHSHTDPFRCNVCGKQCGNKYAFYSHIMRGHQM